MILIFIHVKFVTFDNRDRHDTQLCSPSRAVPPNTADPQDRLIPLVGSGPHRGRVSKKEGVSAYMVAAVEKVGKRLHLQ